MLCHALFKRFVGKKQKLDVFVWGMRFTVIFLNVMPIYVMNYVTKNALSVLVGNKRVVGKQDRLENDQVPLQYGGGLKYLGIHARKHEETKADTIGTPI